MRTLARASAALALGLALALGPESTPAPESRDSGAWLSAVTPASPGYARDWRGVPTDRPTARHDGSADWLARTLAYQDDSAECLWTRPRVAQAREWDRDFPPR